MKTDKMVLHWKPSAYGDMPDYIIITNDTLKSDFETLANYKTKRGFPTLIVTTEQIYSNYSGVDNAEKIRNYLKAAYNYWGAGLFVLLGGDTAVIPARIGYYFDEGTPKEEKNPTDLYYSDVYKPNTANYNWNQNGNIRFGEVSGDGVELGIDNFIGRAPADTIEEVKNFIQKIITYESLTGVNDKSYVNNMLFLGAYHYHKNSDLNTLVGGQVVSSLLAYHPH